MVRLSLALFALVGFAGASASAAVSDSSKPSHNTARSGAHNRMVKVRNAPPASVPVPSVEDTPSTNSTNLTSYEERSAPSGKYWKRDPFRFTYYKTGLGACGAWSTDTDYIAALNSAQWDNGAHCFKTIGVWYNGKQTQATIVDECPGCPEGGLDFSPGLFQFFDDLSVGVLYGNWWFAD